MEQNHCNAMRSWAQASHGFWWLEIFVKGSTRRCINQLNSPLEVFTTGQHTHWTRGYPVSSSTPEPGLSEMMHTVEKMAIMNPQNIDYTIDGRAKYHECRIKNFRDPWFGVQTAEEASKEHKHETASGILHSSRSKCENVIIPGVMKWRLFTGTPFGSSQPADHMHSFWGNFRKHNHDLKILS